MDLDCTEVFEKTYEAFHEITNSDEIEKSNFKIDPIHRYRQIVSMGGTRSSKSYSILQLLLLEMVSRSNIKITVWRNMKNVCRSTVLEDFQRIIMFDYSIYKDIKENKQHGSFTYMPTGSRIVFEGADDIGKVLGSQQTISFFNEITEFREDVYLQITQRTSDRVICDYNPSKNFFLEKHRTNPNTKFIHSTYKDNFFCPPQIQLQVAGYDPWEEGSYDVIDSKVYYNGQPISPTNQPPPHILNVKNNTANEYMHLVYGLGIGAEKPNKIYRGWRQISDEQFNALPYESYFGLDFGASNPTAMVEVKYNGDGAFFIRERLYTPLQDIDDSLPTVIHLRVPQAVKGKSLIVCDSAKDSYRQMLANSGYHIVGATKGGGSIEVGITLVQGFQIYFVPTDNLLFEEQNYSWQVDSNGRSLDTPLKADDHLMDAIRYIISYLVRYLNIKV